MNKRTSGSQRQLLINSDIVAVCMYFVVENKSSNVVFQQGKKTDGSVNAYAVNVTMKRKYRYVNNQEVISVCPSCSIATK